jgi:hypothetical protein
VTDAALLSLAIYASVWMLRALYEFATARTMTTPAKVLLVVLVTPGLSVLLFDEWEWSLIVTILAGVGGATVIHRLHRLLGAVGDVQRLQFMQGEARRYRP